jgi:monoamine oxidase
LFTKPVYVSWSKIPNPSVPSPTTATSNVSAYAHLDKPQGRTHFAGDYLSRLVGWQKGAVLSAHHAIGRIAQQIRG